MARRRANGRVPQTITHRGQLAEGPIQFLRFGDEHLPVDAQSTIRRKHQRNLIEGESCGAPQCDDREALQNAGIE